MSEQYARRAYGPNDEHRGLMLDMLAGATKDFEKVSALIMPLYVWIARKDYA